MNSLLLSFESKEKDDINSIGPNQFCLKFFTNSDESLVRQNRLERYQPTSQNISNYFQLQQLSQQHSSNIMFDEIYFDCPQLDQFINKQPQFIPLVLQQVLPQFIPQFIPQVLIQAQETRKVIPAIRDYNKNICRNIIRHAIRAMNSMQGNLFLQDHLDSDQVAQFVNYFQLRLEQFSGFRVLKDNIIAKMSDDKSVRERKSVLNKYLVWFIENRATLYILQGEANNVREYIKYKNEVLMFYLKSPLEWYSNKPLWKNTNNLRKKRKYQKKK